MRVAILKRRKAPHAALLDGRFHCGGIGSGTLSLTRMPQHSAPSSITCNTRRIPSRSASSRRMIITLDILTYPRKPGSILQELRSLQHDQLRSRLTIPPSPSRVLTFLSSGLVTAIHLHCLERAFEAQNSSGLAYLDRLLLSLIYHSSKDDDHARAMRDLASAQKRRCIVFSNRFPELNHQARSLSSGRQGIRAPKDTDNGLSDSKVRLPRYVTGSLIIPSVTLAIR